MSYELHNFATGQHLYAEQLNEMDREILNTNRTLYGGSRTVTKVIESEHTYTDGFFCQWTNGKMYTRAGESTSSYIAIPDGVEKVTVRCASSTPSGGFCFFTRANTSAGMTTGGQSMLSTSLKTVVADVPEGAKYIQFSTREGYKDESYVSYETEEVVYGTGIIDQIGIIKNGLPDYYQAEIDRVGNKIIDDIKYGDVVFGVYTDIHYDNDYNTAYKPNMRQLTAMNVLANQYPLDLTLDGGDLLTYCTYDFSKKMINDDMITFAGCRVPHLIAKGDHDSAQRDNPISKHEFAARTYPYMPQVVRCEYEPNNYYYDIPGKNTRFIVIDSGTAMAGQSGDDFAANMENIYTWLLSDVFTDEVKNGWNFIVFSHAPHDCEWNVGMAKRGALGAVRYNQIILLDILDAINEGVAYHQNAVPDQMNRTWYYDTDGVLTQDTTATEFVSIMGRIKKEFDKDFTGWTSKVRLLCSGHTHCDRLNKVTNGIERSYAIAYTGGAQYNAYKDLGYYGGNFGTEGRIATWSNLRDRTTDNISEALMDIYVVRENEIKVYRFGCGSDRQISL